MTYIEIAPIGDVDSAVLDKIAVAVSEVLAIPTRTRHRALPLPKSAYHPVRRQYSSTALLQVVEGARDAGSCRTLGVADVDLYASRLNFVFGEAALGGEVAVISLTRLRPEFYGLAPNADVFERRATIEAVHELGHNFGLQHCPLSTCVMHFSRRIEESDRKGFLFCSECAERIGLARQAA